MGKGVVQILNLGAQLPPRVAQPAKELVRVRALSGAHSQVPKLGSHADEVRPHVLDAGPGHPQLLERQLPLLEVRLQIRDEARQGLPDVVEENFAKLPPQRGHALVPLLQIAPRTPTEELGLLRVALPVPHPRLAFLAVAQDVPA
ncbi:unnamed protein product [Parascedosporium putredinis]|uniref:Uncharacterized protein n=1 Tax=Parascedosporium putredinis TaxID=1442378 RepID=A0A9P1H862_9PEZI|nr:unnamed protein product [Parascedosporium putredinis]CAI8000375.1 unnamed protein product [Parascedosporium putredinis]